MIISMKKVIAILLFLGLSFGLSSNIVKADHVSIQIDGDFSDWSSVGHTELSTDNIYFENAAVVFDSMFIYVHVKETLSEQWETRYPEITFNVDGTQKTFRITRTDYSGADGNFQINVQNSWGMNIHNSEGVVRRTNKYNEWEIKLPIHAVFTQNGDDSSADNLVEFEASSISASWNMYTFVSLNGTNIGSTSSEGPEEEVTPTPEPGEEVTPTPEPGEEITPTPDEGEQPGSVFDPSYDSTLRIDGYEDDWENIPKTNITYKSWNNTEYHQGAVVIHDGYVYFYVKMAGTYQAQIPLDEMYFTVNGVQKAFILRYKNDDNSINWDSQIYNLSDGIHKNIGVFNRDGASIAVGEAAIAIDKANKDQWFEARIRIDQLESIMGLDRGTVENGARIEFYSPNLGSESVIVVGTSTGPILGITLGVSAVLIGGIYRGKRKRLNKC